MATAISVIGLLVAAVIFVIAVWKGLDVFTSTILVSFIIILTSWMDWWDSLTLYASGYVGFIQNNVFVLVIGAVFGELMAASGCAESIANVITEKMGAKRVILSITLITTIFVYVGVSGFVVLFVMDRNDHDETGRISIQNDPCDHLYRSHLFCNDSLCDQYHQYYACTVSWDFHGLCTNPRMGCIPCILWDRLLLHGSRSKKSSCKGRHCD